MQENYDKEEIIMYEAYMKGQNEAKEFLDIFWHDGEFPLDLDKICSDMEYHFLYVPEARNIEIENDSIYIPIVEDIIETRRNACFGITFAYLGDVSIVEATGFVSELLIPSDELEELEEYFDFDELCDIFEVEPEILSLKMSIKDGFQPF